MAVIQYYEIIEGSINTADGLVESGEVVALSEEDAIVLNADQSIELKSIDEGEYSSRKSQKPTGAVVGTPVSPVVSIVQQEPKKGKNDRS